MLWASNSISLISFETAAVSGNAGDHVVIQGSINVPAGMKVLGIVGIKSNHNLSVTYGRVDITSSGYYSIVANTTVKQSIKATIDVLMCSS